MKVSAKYTKSSVCHRLPANLPPKFMPILRCSLAIFHIYDDHEFRSNFAGEANDSTPFFKNATNAYDAYHGQANFQTGSSLLEQTNYYDFRYGDSAFFVLDTRRYRSAPVAEKPEDEENRTMLGDNQLAALHEWAGKVNSTATFKFIVSSVPLTSLWRGIDGHIDTWAGYPAERAKVLALLSSLTNTIVITGDRHEFAAIEYFDGAIHEFSTSPMSQFYVPFIKTLSASRSPMYAVQKVVDDLDRATGRVDTDSEVDTGEGEPGEPIVDVVTEYFPEEKLMRYIPHGKFKWYVYFFPFFFQLS